MLNRQISSSKRKNEEKKKKSPRSPLRDLNGFAASHCGRRTCSITSSSSSSTSVEASRGCLRLLLPASSASKNPLRRSKATPKSAPNGKSSAPSSSSSRSNKLLKENLPKPRLVMEKLKKTPHYIYQMQCGKKPNSKASQKPMPSTGTSGSLGDNLVFGSEQLTTSQCGVPMVDESGESPKLLKLPDLNIAVESSTPVAKVECGSGFTCDFDCNPVEEGSTPNTAIKTITPPVQASVSPEIQCGPSMLAATPACYGAGHIVSGVTDRRKCRAKGILTVGANTSCAKANFFHNSDGVETLSKPRVSLVPLPAEASMRWLLSTCDKEDDYQTIDLENGMHCLRTSFATNTLHCVSSPSSGHRVPYKVFENSSSTSKSCGRRTSINFLSPSGSPTYHVAPTCEALISQEKRKHRCDLAREDSPFSIDSLGSGNVIHTPQSDLRSNRHVRLSRLNSHYPQNNNLGSGLDSLEKVLMESLSPNTHISISDPPGLNFQISDLISPTNSIELMHFAKTWDNRASCTSNSSLDDMSPSHMRISWREGLPSRIFEMEEFVCHRCLSDDENDVTEGNVVKFKCSPNHELHFDVGSGAVHCNDFGSSYVVGPEPKSDREPKEKFPEQRTNPCSESICTDGSGLFASADSDWTLCYKNHLFE